MVKGSKTGHSLITGSPLKGTASRRSPKQKSKSSGGNLKGGGMAGQAHVAAEGLETEVDRGTRVVPAEQEARAGPAEQEARVGPAEQGV